MWEDPPHWVWWHPLASCGCSKKAGWSSHRKQACKLCSSLVSSSVPALNSFPAFPPWHTVSCKMGKTFPFMLLLGHVYWSKENLTKKVLDMFSFTLFGFVYMYVYVACCVLYVYMCGMLYVVCVHVYGVVGGICVHLWYVLCCMYIHM